MHLIEALFASQWNFLALFFHFSPLRMQLSWTFLGLIHFSARYIYCACVYVCVCVCECGFVGVRMRVCVYNSHGLYVG